MGWLLGSARVRVFWQEPAEFDWGKAREHLRFDLDNVIALQLAEPIRRTPWLDKCDPHHTCHLPWLFAYPGHFEQYIVVGRALQTPQLKVHRIRVLNEGQEGHVACDLRSEDSRLALTVAYRWRADEPTLHKIV